jgi:two-component system osmolarity sensor histidine kinase EnvZ
MLNGRWLKKYLPKSLFGRSILILAIPIMLIQTLVSVIFVDRLYGDVTVGKTADIAREINYVLTPDSTNNDPLSFIQSKARPLDIQVTSHSEPYAAPDEIDLVDISGRYLIPTLRTLVPGVTSVDLRADERIVRFWVSRGSENYEINLSRRRATAINPHQLLVAGILASGLFIGIAIMFLRNQVKPIRLLAKSAEAFGKGEKIPFSPSGAAEVRQAGHAFVSMQARIERHLEQRTAMLSGVSHDLRTPLTRMKLSLSLLDQNDSVTELQSDVVEMEGIVNEFLAFSRGDSGEELSLIDPKVFVKSLVRDRRRADHEVSTHFDGLGADQIRLYCRVLAMSRAINNLLSNAARYSEETMITVTATPKVVSFIVEDSGPGIPKEERADAVKPFERLDAARNQNKGTGTGLGLAIVSDIARSHGGQLILGHSQNLGGLRAEIQIPR